MLISINVLVITKVGDEILILLDNPTSTLGGCGRGPYSNIQVYANGTIVTFQQTMHTTEQINIHCIKPFQR